MQILILQFLLAVKATKMRVLGLPSTEDLMPFRANVGVGLHGRTFDRDVSRKVEDLL